MINRRSFLRGAVAVPLLSRVNLAIAEDRIRPIGLQLYTVRGELQKDFERTLARVAAIGYQEVELAYVGEFAGGFGRSPQQVRKTLQDSGLTAVSAHVQFESLGERWAESVDAARTIGQTYLVVNSLDRASLLDPALRAQSGMWERAAERLNRAGEVSRVAGIQLGYHNHVLEFGTIQGTSRRPYDVLLEATEPSLVSMQMDLGWFIAAGQDPAADLRRRPGRFSSVHVKDLKRRPRRREPIRPLSALNQDVADVGQGVIEWPTLLAHCWSAGIRHYFVEHDSPSAPFKSVTNSFGYLNRLRFNASAR